MRKFALYIAAMCLTAIVSIQTARADEPAKAQPIPAAKMKALEAAIKSSAARDRKNPNMIKSRIVEEGVIYSIRLYNNGQLTISWRRQSDPESLRNEKHVFDYNADGRVDVAFIGNGYNLSLRSNSEWQKEYAAVVEIITHVLEKG